MSMQIKTIRKKLDASEEFDAAVNAAVSEGWLLTRRTVLQPPSQPHTSNVYFHTMLYAELVKDDTTAQKPEPEPITWQQAVETIKGICSSHEECCDDNCNVKCPLFGYCVEMTPDWGVPLEWPEVPHD